MAKMVKCNECNILIDELLTFIQYKINVLDEETVIQICKSAFTSTDIERSKNTLYECIAKTSNTAHAKARRGDKKELRDLEDIIRGLKETDPDKLPIFVARNLSKLPPVTCDHVDVTTLLKDINNLKTDIRDLKSKSVTAEEVTKLRAEMQDLFQRPHPTPAYPRSFVQQDSGPMGLDGTLYLYPEASPTSINHPINQLTTSIAPAPAHSKELKSLFDPPPAASQITQSVLKSSSADNCDNDDQGFKTVSYKKKRRNSNIKGSNKNTPTTRLKAAPRVAYVYLSNIDFDVSFFLYN